MPNEKILIIVSDENLGPMLEGTVLRPAGYDAVLVTVYRAAESFAMTSPPNLVVLGEKFPDAQFLITGVLGPHSNAHGPNEFLHIPTATKLTCCVAGVIAKHYAYKYSSR